MGQFDQPCLNCEFNLFILLLITTKSSMNQSQASKFVHLGQPRQNQISIDYQNCQNASNLQNYDHEKIPASNIFPSKNQKTHQNVKFTQQNVGSLSPSNSSPEILDVRKRCNRQLKNRNRQSDQFQYVRKKKPLRQNYILDEQSESDKLLREQKAGSPNQMAQYGNIEDQENDHHGSQNYWQNYNQNDEIVSIDDQQIEQCQQLNALGEYDQIIDQDSLQESENDFGGEFEQKISNYEPRKTNRRQKHRKTVLIDNQKGIKKRRSPSKKSIVNPKRYSSRDSKVKSKYKTIGNITTQNQQKRGLDRYGFQVQKINKNNKASEVSNPRNTTNLNTKKNHQNEDRDRLQKQKKDFDIQQSHLNQKGSSSVQFLGTNNQIQQIDYPHSIQIEQQKVFQKNESINRQNAQIRGSENTQKKKLARGKYIRTNTKGVRRNKKNNENTSSLNNQSIANKSANPQKNQQTFQRKPRKVKRRYFKIPILSQQELAKMPIEQQNKYKISLARSIKRKQKIFAEKIQAQKEKQQNQNQKKIWNRRNWTHQPQKNQLQRKDEDVQIQILNLKAGMQSHPKESVQSHRNASIQSHNSQKFDKNNDISLAQQNKIIVQYPSEKQKKIRKANNNTGRTYKKKKIIYGFKSLKQNGGICSIFYDSDHQSDIFYVKRNARLGHVSNHQGSQLSNVNIYTPKQIHQQEDKQIPKEQPANANIKASNIHLDQFNFSQKEKKGVRNTSEMQSWTLKLFQKGRSGNKVAGLKRNCQQEQQVNLDRIPALKANKRSYERMELQQDQAIQIIDHEPIFEKLPAPVPNSEKQKCKPNQKQLKPISHGRAQKISKQREAKRENDKMLIEKANASKQKISKMKIEGSYSLQHSKSNQPIKRILFLNSVTVSAVVRGGNVVKIEQQNVIQNWSRQKRNDKVSKKMVQQNYKSSQNINPFSRNHAQKNAIQKYSQRENRLKQANQKQSRFQKVQVIKIQQFQENQLQNFKYDRDQNNVQSQSHSRSHSQQQSQSRQVSSQSQSQSKSRSDKIKQGRKQSQNQQKSKRGCKGNKTQEKNNRRSQVQKLASNQRYINNDRLRRHQQNFNFQKQKALGNNYKASESNPRHLSLDKTYRNSRFQSAQSQNPERSHSYNPTKNSFINNDNEERVYNKNGQQIYNLSANLLKFLNENLYCDYPTKNPTKGKLSFSRNIDSSDEMIDYDDACRQDKDSLYNQKIQKNSKSQRDRDNEKKRKYTKRSPRWALFAAARAKMRQQKLKAKNSQSKQRERSRQKQAIQTIKLSSSSGHDEHQDQDEVNQNQVLCGYRKSQTTRRRNIQYIDESDSSVREQHPQQAQEVQQIQQQNPNQSNEDEGELENLGSQQSGQQVNGMSQNSLRNKQNEKYYKRKVIKKVLCGHKNRQYHAKGKCKNCYSNQMQKKKRDMRKISTNGNNRQKSANFCDISNPSNPSSNSGYNVYNNYNDYKIGQHLPSQDYNNSQSQCEQVNSIFQNASEANQNRANDKQLNKGIVLNFVNTMNVQNVIKRKSQPKNVNQQVQGIVTSFRQDERGKSKTKKGSKSRTLSRNRRPRKNLFSNPKRNNKKKQVNTESIQVSNNQNSKNMQSKHDNQEVIQDSERSIISQVSKFQANQNDNQCDKQYYKLQKPLIRATPVQVPDAKRPKNKVPVGSNAQWFNKNRFFNKETLNDSANNKLNDLVKNTKNSLNTLHSGNYSFNMGNINSTTIIGDKKYGNQILNKKQRTMKNVDFPQNNNLKRHIEDQFRAQHGKSMRVVYSRYNMSQANEDVQNQSNIMNSNESQQTHRKVPVRKAINGQEQNSIQSVKNKYL